MEKNKNYITIKSSWAYWGITSVALLTTVAIIVSFVVDMIETQSFVWDYLYYAFWPLVIDAIFIEFSTRRLVINTEKRTLTYKTAFHKKTVELSDIANVQLPKSKLGIFVKVKKASDGKCVRILKEILDDNYIANEKFSKFLMQGKSNEGDMDTSLLEKDTEKAEKVSTFNKALALIVTIPMVAVYVLFFCLHWFGGRPAFPMFNVGVYEFNSFWIMLGGLLFLAIIVGVNKKHLHLINFLASVIFVSFLPLMVVSALGFPPEHRISATQNFENYDKALEEIWGEERYHMPESIQYGEVVAFSYYYDYSWDYVEEVYLEVKYDEEEFNRIYSQYENKDASYFGEEYEEVSFVEDYFVALERSEGMYISYGKLEKIIFDKENRIVIYYYLDVIDPFLIERSMLVKRFDVDIFDYAKYIRDKRDNTN